MAIKPDRDKQNSPDPSPDLLTLYQKLNDRQTLFSGRMESTWMCLAENIKLWQQNFKNQSDQSFLYHHITQFQHYIGRAYNALVTDSVNLAKADNNDESEEFRSLVIGVFTTQWLLLQEVAAQRTKGHPYLESIRELEKDATGYYARLYNTIIPTLKRDKLDIAYRDDPIAAFVPLVHLGRAAQLSVFNRRIPLILDVPFGAVSGMPDASRTRMSIPHEIAHAIFTQVPELINEIKSTLRTKFENDHDLGRRDQLLYFTALEWIEEICADLVGTALADEEFVRSARWIMADSDSSIGRADLEHPPGILRPMIHLHALHVMEPEKGGWESTRQEFEEIIENSNDQRQVSSNLNRRFESLPALMFVSMSTMSKILNDLVTQVLDMELATLSNKTMRELLVEIHNQTNDKLPQQDLDKWGEGDDLTTEQLVVDFPLHAAPTHMIPGVSTNPFCCASAILSPLCCV